MKHSLHLDCLENENPKYISMIDDDTEEKTETEIVTKDSRNSQENGILLEKTFPEDNEEDGYENSFTNKGSAQGSEVALKGDIESSV